MHAAGGVLIDSLTVTLTAEAGLVVRGLARPRPNRVAVPFWRAWIQLGLAVDVLDDRLTELFLGRRSWRLVKA
jgi:hypothetical protein